LGSWVLPLLLLSLNALMPVTLSSQPLPAERQPPAQVGRHFILIALTPA
jgi:hypothetical protein